MTDAQAAELHAVAQELASRDGLDPNACHLARLGRAGTFTVCGRAFGPQVGTAAVYLLNDLGAFPLPREDWPPVLDMSTGN